MLGKPSIQFLIALGDGQGANPRSSTSTRFGGTKSDANYHFNSRVVPFRSGESASLQSPDSTLGRSPRRFENTGYLSPYRRWYGNSLRGLARSRECRRSRTSASFPGVVHRVCRVLRVRIMHLEPSLSRIQRDCRVASLPCFSHRDNSGHLDNSCSLQARRNPDL